jgi:hypothetical protein
MKMQRLTKILLISFLIVLAISLIDIFPFDGQVLFVVIALIPLAYYILKKDKSGAVSIAVGASILWATGLVDILSFWTRGNKLPKLLPHLDNHSVINSISEFFGYSQVTGTSLLLTSLFGIGVTYFVIKFLMKKL